MLRRSITRSGAINAAIAGLDASMGFGHGAYAGLLFTWLIPFQDRKGRVSADSGWLRTELFPLLPRVDESIIRLYLAELARHGAFLYYEVEGRQYVQFEGISRCNKIPSGEPLSVLPDPTPAALLSHPSKAAGISYQLPLQGREENVDSLPPGIRRKEEEGITTVAPNGAPARSPLTDSSPSRTGNPLTGTSPSLLPDPPSTNSPPLLTDEVHGPASIGSASAHPNGSTSTGPAPASSNGSTSTGPARRKTPIPFSPLESWGTLRSAAPSRFPDDPFPENLRAPWVALIREFPNIDTWRTVGDWLHHGGESWRTRLDCRQVVKAGNFHAWVGESRRWDAAGRPPISGDSRSTPRRNAGTGLITSDARRQQLREAMRE